MTSSRRTAGAACRTPPQPVASDLPFDRLSPAERMLLTSLPGIIGLDEHSESMFAGREAGSLFIRTAPPPLEDLMILRSPTFMRSFLWKGRPTLQAWVLQTVEELANVRAWRSAGTVAPPACTFKTNQFTQVVLKELGLAPQSLLDRVFNSVQPRDVRMPGCWRMEGQTPGLLRQAANMKHAEMVRREREEPWLAGRCINREFALTGVSISPELALIGEMSPLHDKVDRYEIRVATRLPESLTVAGVGRAVADIVEHPVVARLGGTVERVEIKAASTRLSVAIGERHRTPLADEHVDELERHRAELLGRVPAITDEMCAAIIP